MKVSTMLMKVSTNTCLQVSDDDCPDLLEWSEVETSSSDDDDSVVSSQDDKTVQGVDAVNTRHVAVSNNTTEKKHPISVTQTGAYALRQTYRLYIDWYERPSIGTGRSCIYTSGDYERHQCCNVCYCLLL
jgi:hypothetical protein